MITISDRIFDKLKQIDMSQKTFSEKTGISQSTISEWKSKRTNPTSEKIMIICSVLGVTPEWLLSGVDPAASRNKNHAYYVIDVQTDPGSLVADFNKLGKSQRDRILGYVEAMIAMAGEK